MHFQTDFPPEQLQQRRQRLMDDIGTDAVAVIGGAGATGAFDYLATVQFLPPCFAAYSAASALSINPESIAVGCNR